MLHLSDNFQTRRASSLDSSTDSGSSLNVSNVEREFMRVARTGVFSTWARPLPLLERESPGERPVAPASSDTHKCAIDR